MAINFLNNAIGTAATFTGVVTMTDRLVLGDSLNNSFIGEDAGVNNTTGIYNVSLGYKSLYSNAGGNRNLGLGNQSLYYNTEGDGNVALGTSSLQSNTTGDYNIALGFQSLYQNTTGGYNVALGVQSLRFNTGSFNIALGIYALYNNTTASSNIALGHSSLIDNTTGLQNVALGFMALGHNTTGGYNIGFGTEAGKYALNGATSNTTGQESIFIGKNTRANANGEINQIVIGDAAIGKGSNTVTLGNNNIATTYLKGAIVVPSYGAGTLVTDASGNITSVPAGPATETLAQTLAQGNTTSGKDIEMSTGDSIKFDSEFIIEKSGTAGSGGNLNGQISLSNGDSNSLLRILNQNGKIFIYAGPSVQIQANKTQINGGFVGINNATGSNPQDQLHVNGTIRAAMALNNGSANPTGFAFKALNDAGTAATGFYYDNNGAQIVMKNRFNVQNVKISTTGSDTYFNGGRFGVGTTSPSKTFDVQGSARINTLDFLNYNSTNFIYGPSNGLIYFGAPQSYNQNIQVQGTIRAEKSIQIGMNWDAASASLVGSQRYNETSNSSYVEMCMKTGANTYAWVEIKKNTW